MRRGDDYDRLNVKRAQVRRWADQRASKSHRAVTRSGRPEPCRAEGCERRGRYRHCEEHYLALVDGKLPCPGCGEYVCGRGATCAECLLEAERDLEQRKRDLRSGGAGPW